MTVEELQSKFGIDGCASVVPGLGGLPKVVVTTPDATGEMYLHGGHVTSWRPRGHEDVLFVSSSSLWQDGRAIRGGVPVCFPWFGGKADNAKAPAHGLVRTVVWDLDSVRRDGDAVTVAMSTASNAATKAWWPGEYRLTHRVTFGAALTMDLVIENASTEPQRFEEALHAYYSIGDVTQIRVRGLDGIEYLDKTDGNQRKQQRGEAVIASETDRVYLETTGAVELVDPVLRRTITVEKVHSGNTVLWNPWQEKARSLHDLADGEWKRMVCIEGCNAGDGAVTLAPGAQHSMRITVRVNPSC
jgi:glucose-6-phosphate 1-epimerase